MSGGYPAPTGSPRAGVLASSPRARLRLRITDGFNTTVTPARPVVVLPRAPAVTIIEPALHQRVQGGEMLYLQGAAADGGGHSLAGGRCGGLRAATCSGPARC
jgi:hypothetical protein